MTKRIAAGLILLLTAAAANGQQQPVAVQNSAPWVVSVVHTVDLQRMLAKIREQRNLRVGIAPSAPAYVYNVATGLIVDRAGHVVTRLANLDLQEKDPKITITTSTGASVPARLIGVDCATGFAVLEAALVGNVSPAIAPAVSVKDGMPVNIVSADVVQRAIPSNSGTKFLLTPELRLVGGNVLASSPYAKARGAMTVQSTNLMARNDSSIVETPDHRVIGIAQWAGFGRAYLFPFEFLRDTIAKRVIDRKDNVPAGWLGAVGVSLAQVPESELSALGVVRRVGVMVTEVLPESPAAAGGILPRDVIVALDEWDVNGAADLKAMLSWSPAGRRITLKGIRNREPVNLSVVLGAQPNAFTMANWVLQEPADPLLYQREEVEKRLGELQLQYKTQLTNQRSRERDEALRELEIEMRQLMDMHRAVVATADDLELQRRRQATEYAGANVNTDQPHPDVTFLLGFTARELMPQLAATKFQARGGILVSSVVKESPADRAGIKAGDVIVSSRDRMIMSIAQLQALLSTQRGQMTLNVLRDGSTISLVIDNQ